MLKVITQVTKFINLLHNFNIKNLKKDMKLINMLSFITQHETKTENIQSELLHHNLTIY